jgi:hypothetical protein
MSLGDHAKTSRCSWRKADTNDDELGRLALIQQDLLGVVGRLELKHWRLANWHVLLSECHAVEELALLFGDDQRLGQL